MKYTGFHRALEIDHKAHRNSWQIHVCNEIEVDQLDILRDTFRSKGLRPPSYTAMVIKAIAMALNEYKSVYPQTNSFLKNYFGFKSISTFDGISGGCSTALESEDAVTVGVVLEPQRKPLSEITYELSQFSDPKSKIVTDVRMYYRLPRILQVFLHWLSQNSSSLRYKHRGTFCINPVGKFGIDYHLSLPQTSSLQFGMGTARERVVARDSKPFVTKTFYLSASFDRRLMNGRPVAQLMERVRQILNAADFKEDR